MKTFEEMVKYGMETYGYTRRQAEAYANARIKAREKMRRKDGKA